MFALSAKVEGERLLLDRFERVKTSVARKHLRAGMRKAGSLLTREMKNRIPKESGASRLAVGHKEFGKGRRQGVVAGVRRGEQFVRQVVRELKITGYGRRTNIRYTNRRLRRDELAAGRIGTRRDPAKIAHLIERGRRAVSARNKKALTIAGRGGFFLRPRAAQVAGSHFTARSYRAQKGACTQIIQAEVKAAVNEAGKV